MKAIARVIVEALRIRRRERVARVVDQVQLYGGSALHVVDVGPRRLIFATSSAAICLLAQLDCEAAVREERSCGVV